MPTTVYTAYATNNNAANFRDWGSRFETALAAVGLVKTADTGQINWTTVSNPTSPGQIMGYAIYRFNDALQATAPVFLRFSFGSAAANTFYPAITLETGTGTDGAGNITGQKLAPTQFAAESGSLQSDCYVSGDTNRFMAYLWGSSVNAFMLCLERSRDNNGAMTTDGLMLYFFSTTQGKSKYISNSIATTLYTGGVNTFAPPQGTGTLAPDVNAYPVRAWKPEETAPCLNLLSYVNGDFNFGNVTYSVVCYDGVTRTYISSNSFGSLFAASAGNVVSRLLMLWS